MPRRLHLTSTNERTDLMTYTYLASPSILLVVETEDDAFIGTVEERDIATPDHVLVIRTGYVGAPNVVPVSEVTRICRAERHPDVVLL